MFGLEMNWGKLNIKNATCEITDEDGNFYSDTVEPFTLPTSRFDVTFGFAF